MKVMIASDLHGAEDSVELLAERYAEEKPFEFCLLGDFLLRPNSFPDSDEYEKSFVTKWLNEIAEKIVAVRGNCDTEKEESVLNFALNDPTVMLFVDGRQWILSHGNEVNEHSFFDHEDGAILLTGHTHIKVFEKCRDFYHLNPGSVGRPFDGTASYLIYEDGVFIFKDLYGNELSRHFL